MKKNDLNFESIVQELDGILEKMSSDETTLDESIQLYAKAAGLIQQGHTTLASAKIKIDEIDLQLQQLQTME